MSITKNVSRGVFAAACLLLAPESINADTFALQNGDRIEGTVTGVLASQVTIETDSGPVTIDSLSDFSDDSRQAVAAWIESNPEKVDVYDQWDVKPAVVRSKNAVTPMSLCNPGFKGLVSLYVVLDESGQVIHAEVAKSTHDALVEPAIDAVRAWKFKPAVVAGDNVKSKIAISFQFKA